MKKRNEMIICLAGLMGSGMLTPENATAVDGHCVAFCDEPSAPEPSSDGAIFHGGNQESSAPLSHNEIQTKRLNAEGIQAKQDGHYLDAIFRYEEALGFANGFPDAEAYVQAIQQNIAKAQNAIGVEAYERNDYITAVTYFEFAIASDPDTAIYRENLEDARSSLGYHEVYNPSGAPLFSQGNAHSAPVDLRDKEAGGGELPAVDPGVIQGETPGQPKTLKTRAVPLPPALQKLNESAAFRHDIYDGFEDHADMVLDALEKGEGDLDKSIAYLEDRVNTEGQGIVGTDALSYLEGLKVGAVAHDADTPPDVFKDKELQNELGGESGVDAEAVFEAGMLEAAAKMLEEQAAKHGFENWRVSRTKRMLYALEEGQGDLEKSLAYLDRERQNLLSPTRQEADNAYNYLRGLHAYPTE